MVVGNFYYGMKDAAAILQSHSHSTGEQITEVFQKHYQFLQAFEWSSVTLFFLPIWIAPELKDISRWGLHMNV